MKTLYYNSVQLGTCTDMQKKSINTVKYDSFDGQYVIMEENTCFDITKEGTEYVYNRTDV